jgi:glycosyltransferase involved in cell wall biosynthesis
MPAFQAADYPDVDLVYLCLPTGYSHGWGVCGNYLVRELAALTTVKLFTFPLNGESAPDELGLFYLKQCLASEEETARAGGPEPVSVACPVVQAISDNLMTPIYPSLEGSRRVGYTFFEDSLLPAGAIENARRYFDVVAAGSSWCERILRDHGLTATATIVQGVDPQIFNSTASEKSFLKDRFVVFSGGKFELRKGQDLVLRAYKVLQDRHRDTLLVTSWFNRWEFSMNTMRASPYIRFNPGSRDYVSLMQRLMVDNGVDPRRVVHLPPQPNGTMAGIYKNTDVGLFPNRCEGGTNLVLMEYMACGKPAIASLSSGHKDVLTDRTAICIRNAGQMCIQQNGRQTGTWDDPNLDEIIHHLEWAYQNRDEIARIGQRAGEHMRQFTWARTARQFLELLEGESK